MEKRAKCKDKMSIIFPEVKRINVKMQKMTYEKKPKCCNLCVLFVSIVITLTLIVDAQHMQSPIVDVADGDLTIDDNFDTLDYFRPMKRSPMAHRLRHNHQMASTQRNFHRRQFNGNAQTMNDRIDRYEDDQQDQVIKRSRKQKNASHRRGQRQRSHQQNHQRHDGNGKNGN